MYAALGQHLDNVLVSQLLQILHFPHSRKIDSLFYYRRRLNPLDSNAAAIRYAGAEVHKTPRP